MFLKTQIVKLKTGQVISTKNLIVWNLTLFVCLKYIISEDKVGKTLQLEHVVVHCLLGRRGGSMWGSKYMYSDIKLQ